MIGDKQLIGPHVWTHHRPAGQGRKQQKHVFMFRITVVQGHNNLLFHLQMDHEQISHACRHNSFHHSACSHGVDSYCSYFQLKNQRDKWDTNTKYTLMLPSLQTNGFIFIQWNQLSVSHRQQLLSSFPFLLMSVGESRFTHIRERERERERRAQQTWRKHKHRDPKPGSQGCQH